MINRITAVFIFLFSLPNFLVAADINSLTEENFGERFYGVYFEEVKLGYLIHEISQTDEAVIQDFSMNMRMTLSEEDEREHKAKYAFSQIASRYQFKKDTGLLSAMTEADRKKYYADFSSLLDNNHFKQEISTLTAQYKGNFSYEVLISDKDGETSKLLKLPTLHMYDYFAEINFILSDPDVGESRAIEVFDLDLVFLFSRCGFIVIFSNLSRWSSQNVLSLSIITLQDLPNTKPDLLINTLSFPIAR